MAVNASFVGKRANPITQARIEMAMSGPALAKRLGLSRQYLSRAEQGTYSSLNPALLRWTSNALSMTVGSIEKRYVAFQKAQRRATIEKVNPHRLERHGSGSPGGVLFEKWRSGYWTSPTAFAVAFCVHPDSITKYEEGITKSMPKALREAMIEADILDEHWKDEIEPSETDATGASLRA